MAASNSDEGRLQPWRENPRFWEHGGEPVVLLGGTVDDNLFQVPDLEAHLDLLVSTGGNYVRNTMSDRPDEGYEIKAYARGDDGSYDLTRWNDEYWERFARLLKLTSQRQVFVQIEIWDRFDHSQHNWESDPFNPKNNSNYSHEESGLAAAYPDHPGKNQQPFFYTVPGLQNNETVLAFQRAFVDQVLAHSLTYDHVLYCMDNETSGDPAWSAYWAEHIRQRAREAGVAVEVTEMWDKWDVRDDTHRATFDHPDRYTFVDISQNSHTVGEPNWDHAQWVRTHLTADPRPMNSTKIYGADTSKWTDRGITRTHATQTFWRNLIGGFASSRFHRPPSGLGLSDAAQVHLRSARMLMEVFDVFGAEPDSDHALLSERVDNEAYLTRVPGQQYAVYFTDGGYVEVDLAETAGGTFRLRWLEIEASRWHEAGVVSGKDLADLPVPGSGPWVALLTRT